MVSDRIKQLRLSNNMTQTDLAKKLNITRSSVNAWEMGISTLSTTYLVELAQLFHVSTDYLLGLSDGVSLDISNLSEKEVQLVYDLVRYFREKNSSVCISVKKDVYRTHYFSFSTFSIRLFSPQKLFRRFLRKILIQVSNRIQRIIHHPVLVPIIRHGCPDRIFYIIFLYK